ncbi:MAG: hypothetical protein WBQ72_01390 [Terriglobales bacterium]|jgi:hypothetical protein
MRKSKTHFEQVPVALVKKIANQYVPAKHLDDRDSVTPTISPGRFKLGRLPPSRKNERGA